MELIRDRRSLIRPVVPFDPSNDRLISMDFTAGNTTLTDDILQDAASFNRYVFSRLESNRARYGIGGYAEHRTVYRFSRVFDAEQAGDEPRRLHLGIDIWGKPQTAVMAPLEGLVHSFANNDNRGDYGATILLIHRLSGYSFCTLYGHLSLSSIRNLHEGQRIEAGEIFAEFGIPAENGGWPPHLHFQVILDPGNAKGDYPGVCKYSERESWLANSPDPDLILGMNRFVGL